MSPPALLDTRPQESIYTSKFAEASKQPLRALSTVSGEQPLSGLGEF